MCASFSRYPNWSQMIMTSKRGGWWCWCISLSLTTQIVLFIIIYYLCGFLDLLQFIYCSNKKNERKKHTHMLDNRVLLWHILCARMCGKIWNFKLLKKYTLALISCYDKRIACPEKTKISIKCRHTVWSEQNILESFAVECAVSFSHTQNTRLISSEIIIHLFLFFMCHIHSG